MTDLLPIPTAIQRGLSCRCPRCGRGALFAGFLKVAPRCTSCGLDLGFADSGDGPAIFIIFIVGALIIAMAAIVESLWHPPAFVHLLLWLPGTVILCLALLRPFKGVMVALQFRNDAREGTH